MKREVSPTHLVLTEEPAGSPEARALLARVTWGSPGGVRYRVRAHDFDRITGATALVARHAGLAVGHYAFVPHDWGYLRLLLAVDPEYRGTGAGRLLVEEGKRLFENRLGPGQVLAGTIEADNSASLRLSERAGYARVGCFEALTFARSHPRRAPELARPTDEQHFEIVSRLQARGRGFAAVANGLRREECFVWCEHGRPVAGVQAVVQRWQIETLGGALGRILPHLLPLFGHSANDYGFASLHLAWGDPARFERLFEAVLAALNLRSALLIHDLEDGALHAATQRLSRGALGMFAGRQRLWLMASGDMPRPLPFTAVFAL